MSKQDPGEDMPVHDRSVPAGDELTLTTQSQQTAADSIPQETFEKVERAKREWEATADSLSDLICLLDDAGCVLRANRAVEGWGLGPVQSVIGRPLHSLLHPAGCGPACDLRAFLTHASEQALLGEPAELETNDEILQRCVFVRVRPVQEQRNVTPRTFVVVAQDISERKRAERALQSYNARLETMNQIGQAILAARSPEQIVQAALSRIRRHIPYQWASVALSDPESGQLLVLAGDAGPGGVAPQPGMPLPPGTISARFPLVAETEFIGCMDLGAADLSALSEEHMAIAREVADQLAVAICQARLNRQLEQANRELREALLAKDEMIQNVSHELRTPLTIIEGYTELLREGGLGRLTPEQRTAVQAIDGHSRRLCDMVERLLIMQTLSLQRPINARPTELGPLVSETAGHWQVRYQSANVTLGIEVEDGLPPLMADDKLLAQVVYNLLDNALKFSPPASHVHVRVHAEDGHYRLVVSDQGIGIAPDKLEKVFDRFYQVDGGLNRAYGGMGIGLALCRKIVEAHGGHIWAESAGEGRGSAFHVALPVTADPNANDRML